MRFVLLAIVLATAAASIGSPSETKRNMGLRKNDEEADVKSRRKGDKKVREVKVIGGAHFGWGIPMDDMADDVKPASKVTKKVDTPTKKRRWGLPLMDSTQRVEEAFDGLE